MTIVIACNEVAGTHCWENCPVGFPHPYLKSPHRHIFFIETEFEVSDEDRQIEIFEAQDNINRFIEKHYGKNSAGIDFGGDSCEMIARKIVEAMGAKQCTVREDNKGGATYVRS